MIKHLGDTMPRSLSADTEVAFWLVGDETNTRHIEKAGRLNWALIGQPGRIAGYLPITTGSLLDTRPGTAARSSLGKPRLDLIPAGIIAAARGRRDELVVGRDSALALLGAFQMRLDDGACLDALAALDDDGQVWAEAAAVFEYGLKKYDAWNWLRGMPWSITIGCAMRHLTANEPNDPESGLPHRGHAACNLVMLAWYAEHYRAGDDRPLRLA